VELLFLTYVIRNKGNLLNPDIKTKPIEKITVDDFDIVGYFPHPPIRAPMAI
jgi:thymidylate synthase